MTPQTLALIAFAFISIIILAFAFVVLWKIINNTISLDGLVAEPPSAGVEGKASLSRFQFLLFTFVIAGLFLLLSIESGTFVNIPDNVLILLGLSGGTYVVSKTVTATKKKDETPPDTTDTAKPRPRRSAGADT